MQVTLTIDDALYAKVMETAGPDVRLDDLFGEALTTFVRVQAANRLAALGGAAPEMKDVPRRREQAEQAEQAE